MSGFTKGPWHCEGTLVYAKKDICTMLPDNGIVTQEKLANAALISAAPELLENLAGCVEALASYAPDCIEVQCARAALSKAAGEGV